MKPSETERASPIVFHSKSYRTLIFSVHYTKLNAVTTGKSYPIPLLDGCIDRLGDPTMSLVLHNNCGYCKFKVSGEDWDKTEFTVYHGLIRFTRMLSWLNRLDTSQSAMNVLLSNVKWHFALVYLDDITVFPCMSDDYLRLVSKVWTLLNQASETRNLKIRVFHKFHCLSPQFY